MPSHPGKKQMTRKSKDPNVIDIKPLPFPVVRSSSKDRPSLGSGAAEKAAKDIEKHKSRTRRRFERTLNNDND